MRVISRWMCVVAPAIFITSAAWGEPIATGTGGRPANAAAESAAPSSDHRALAEALPLTPQRARMAIASFLEQQERYRKYDKDGAPKLTGAQIAGPAKVSRLQPPQPVYCVYVDLIMTNRFLWVTHDTIFAIVKFPPSDNGPQKIVAQVRGGIGPPSATSTCFKEHYAPFPEIEHLRAQRRHALGKSDT